MHVKDNSTSSQSKAHATNKTCTSSVGCEPSALPIQRRQAPNSNRSASHGDGPLQPVAPNSVLYPLAETRILGLEGESDSDHRVGLLALRH